MAAPLPTILLADPDRSGLTAIAEGLRGAGYTVAIAVDADEALAKARSQDPAVVCLDVHLPPGGAFAFYPRLREVTQAPVVLMLERLDDAISTGIATSGIADMLLKPLDVIEVIDKVAWYLEAEAEAEA